jgi:hypothetical protein
VRFGGASFLPAGLWVVELWEFCRLLLCKNFSFQNLSSC